MPVKPLQLGTLKSAPGRITYGRLPLLSFPTGGEEHIPLMIAQGQAKGPCLWVTTGIHGDEHAGLQVVHQLVTRDLVRRLHGTLVVIPGLNPAGLRTGQRMPYYQRDDPNRLFPDHPSKEPRPDPPTPVEAAFAQIFEWIKGSADFLIDMHNSWPGSPPFVFRDRVWYDAATQKREARALLGRMNALIDAIGLSGVTEYPMKKYLARNLHRSVSGSTLNVARIPAVTVELGTGLTPDPVIVSAMVTSLMNVMRWAGMLDDAPEPITTVPVVRPPFPARRDMSPRVPVACIIRHLVRPGALLRAGDPVAEMRDIYGRPVAGGVLRSEHEGWVMGLVEGIVRYPRDAVVGMAIRDDEPLIAPYPKKD